MNTIRGRPLANNDKHNSKEGDTSKVVVPDEAPRAREWLESADAAGKGPLFQPKPRKFSASLADVAAGDVRDELNRLGMMAHTAMNQNAGDMRNIMEDLADRLLALAGGHPVGNAPVAQHDERIALDTWARQRASAPVDLQRTLDQAEEMLDRIEAALKATPDATGVEAGIRTLRSLGYTWHGGDVWKAPLSAAPRAGALAADERVPTRCSMGMGCDESGVCYAGAMGEPDKCCAAPVASAPVAEKAQQPVADAYFGGIIWRSGVEIPEHPFPLYAAPVASQASVADRRAAFEKIVGLLAPSANLLWNPDFDSYRDKGVQAAWRLFAYGQACAASAGAPVTDDKCPTCGGHELVGGLTPHSGYDAEPCPDCAPEAEEPTHAMYAAAQRVQLQYGDEPLILNTSQIRAVWKAMQSAALASAPAHGDAIDTSPKRVDETANDRHEASAPVAGVTVAWEDVRDALAMFLSGATGKASKHWIAPLEDATAGGALAKMKACLAASQSGQAVASVVISDEVPGVEFSKDYRDGWRACRDAVIKASNVAGAGLSVVPRAGHWEREFRDVLESVQRQFKQHGGSLPGTFCSHVVRWVDDVLANAPAAAEPHQWNTGDSGLDQLLNIACDVASEGGNHDTGEYLLQLIDAVKARLAPPDASQPEAGEAIHQWRYFGDAAWRDDTAEGFAQKRNCLTAEDLRFRVVYTDPLSSEGVRNATLEEVARVFDAMVSQHEALQSTGPFHSAYRGAATVCRDLIRPEADTGEACTPCNGMGIRDGVGEPCQSCDGDGAVPTAAAK